MEVTAPYCDRPPRVLLVEAVPAGESLGGALSRRGWAVEQANGTPLPERLGRGDVDLVVCDLSAAPAELPELIAAAPGLLGDEHLPPEFVLLAAPDDLPRTIDVYGYNWCQFLTTPVALPVLEQTLARALEFRALRERVNRLEDSNKQVVLRSVEDLTANLSLEGTLGSVLRAADILLHPQAAAIWLAGGPDGQLVPVSVLRADGGQTLEAEHRDLAHRAYEGCEGVCSASGELHLAALPIAVDETVEGVISAAFGRASTLLDGSDTSNLLAALAQHASMAVKKDRQYADLERSSAEIKSLFDVGVAMSSETSLQQLFQVVVESAADVCSARRCSLMLLAEDRSTLQMRAARGIPADVIAIATATVGEGIAGGVAASGKALLVSDIEKDQRFGRKNRAQYSNSSLISVPILVNQRVVGVLNVNDKRDGTSFNEKDLNLLVLLASQAAVAIDNANRYQDLSERAVTDSLTGVYVRRFFDESLERAFRSARTTGRGFSLLMIDIDHFKAVNDQRGHQAGDEALRQVARALGGTVRDEDSVSRYGGEEFAILLARANQQTAMSVAERIRAAVEKTIVKHDGAHFQITVSVGVAAYSEQYDKAADLLAAADRALYQAKESGRNRVVSAPTES